MDPVFFYGSLRDQTLLEIVLDRAVAAADLIEATATGFATRCLPHESYPVLVQEPGSVADGLLLCHPSQGDLARLTYFEEEEYRLVPITVAAADGPVSACYFRGTERAPATVEQWSYDTWRAKDRPAALHAARDLMACFGIVAMGDIDTVWPGIMNRAHQKARGEATLAVKGDLRQGLGRADVEAIALDRPFTGFAAVETHTLRHRRFDGGWEGPVNRVVMLWGDAATVLPYDAARDRVLLIEQFRPGPTARHDPNPWVIEVIAGRIDGDDSPADTAKREAREEAALDLGALEAIPSYYPSPGMAAEHIYGFIGQADLPGTGGIHGLAGEAEDIRSLILPFDDAMAALEAGAIKSGTATLSLLWLARHRDRLRGLWS